MHVRLVREALPAVCLPHLLLRFESNGPHRHSRVAPPRFPAADPLPALIPTDPTPTDDRRRLRRELRARRRAIRGRARRLAGLALARRIDALRLLRHGRLVALFLSMPEEIDTAPLLALARRRGCRLVLPRILSRRQGRMRFHAFDGTTRRGAYGIAEPRGHRAYAARELDVVFLPLVAFDAAGHRMGMGAGYYDRHFAHRLRLRHCRRPQLVGVAYAVQQVPAVPHADHDVPLDLVVTESTTHATGRRAA